MSAATVTLGRVLVDGVAEWARQWLVNHLSVNTVDEDATPAEVVAAWRKESPLYVERLVSQGDAHAVAIEARSLCDTLADFLAAIPPATPTRRAGP